MTHFTSVRAQVGRRGRGGERCGCAQPAERDAGGHTERNQVAWGGMKQCHEAHSLNSLSFNFSMLRWYVEVCRLGDDVVLLPGLCIGVIGVVLCIVGALHRILHLLVGILDLLRRAVRSGRSGLSAIVSAGWLSAGPGWLACCYDPQPQPAKTTSAVSIRSTSAARRRLFQ